MFNPKIFLSSNLRTNKQDNALITQSSIRNKAINLFDWFGVHNPLNSIQYNKNNKFYGDSLFTRNPVTNETVIKRVPVIGTDQGFETNDNLSFISTFISTPIPGTQLFWEDTVSGNGASIVAAHAPGTTDPGIIGIIGNTNKGNAAVYNLGFDPILESWSFNASGNNSTSNTVAQINAVADNTTSKAEIEAENSTTGDISKFSCEPNKALIQYINGVNTNTIITDATGVHFAFDLGGMQISNVPSYIDDAAAIGGGLTSGYLYKTTIAGSTYLKIVP